MTQPALISTPHPKTKTGLPAWLANRLDTPTPRSVRAAHCHTCHTPVLEGLDNDLMAFRAQVDPTPLDRLGEALALLAGRRTYELRAHQYTRLALYRRDRWHIAGRPPGQKGLLFAFDVVADHQCNSALLPSIESVHNSPPPLLEANNENPPF